MVDFGQRLVDFDQKRKGQLGRRVAHVCREIEIGVPHFSRFLREVGIVEIDSGTTSTKILYTQLGEAAPPFAIFEEPALSQPKGWARRSLQRRF